MKKTIYIFMILIPFYRLCGLDTELREYLYHFKQLQFKRNIFYEMILPEMISVNQLSDISNVSSVLILNASNIVREVIVSNWLESIRFEECTMIAKDVPTIAVDKGWGRDPADLVIFHWAISNYVFWVINADEEDFRIRLQFNGGTFFSDYKDVTALFVSDLVKRFVKLPDDLIGENSFKVIKDRGKDFFYYQPEKAIGEWVLIAVYLDKHILYVFGYKKRGNERRACPGYPDRF